MKKIIRISVFVTVLLCSMNVMAQNNDDEFLNAINEAQQRSNFTTAELILKDDISSCLKALNPDTIKTKLSLYCRRAVSLATKTDSLLNIIKKYEMFDSLKNLYTENLKLRKEIEELRQYEKFRIGELADEQNEWLNKTFKEIAENEKAFSDKLDKYHKGSQNNNISPDTKKKLDKQYKSMKALNERYTFYKNCVNALNDPYDKATVDTLLKQSNSIPPKETNSNREGELTEQVELLKKYKETLQYFQFFISDIDDKVGNYKDRKYSKERAYTNLKDYIDKEYVEKNYLSAIDAIPWLKTQRKEYIDSLEKNCYEKNKARESIMNIKL